MGDATAGAGAGGADAEAPSTPGSKSGEKTTVNGSFKVAICKEGYMPCLMPLPPVSVV